MAEYLKSWIKLKILLINLRKQFNLTRKTQRLISILDSSSNEQRRRKRPFRLTNSAFLLIKIISQRVWLLLLCLEIRENITKLLSILDMLLKSTQQTFKLNLVLERHFKTFLITRMLLLSALSLSYRKSLKITKLYAKWRLLIWTSSLFKRAWSIYTNVWRLTKSILWD